MMDTEHARHIATMAAAEDYHCGIAAPTAEDARRMFAKNLAGENDDVIDAAAKAYLAAYQEVE